MRRRNCPRSLHFRAPDRLWSRGLASRDLRSVSSVTLDPEGRLRVVDAGGVRSPGPHRPETPRSFPTGEGRSSRPYLDGDSPSATTASRPCGRRASGAPASATWRRRTGVSRGPSATEVRPAWATTPSPTRTPSLTPTAGGPRSLRPSEGPPRRVPWSYHPVGECTTSSAASRHTAPWVTASSGATGVCGYTSATTTCVSGSGRASTTTSALVTVPPTATPGSSPVSGPVVGVGRVSRSGSSLSDSVTHCAPPSASGTG